MQKSRITVRSAAILSGVVLVSFSLGSDVTAGLLKGSVHAGPDPVEWAEIRLCNESGVCTESLTGESGKFYLDNLPEGSYELELKRAGESVFEGDLNIEPGTNYYEFVVPE